MEMISSTQYLDDVLEGEESEEELYTDNEEEESINKEDAILSWLWTFPQIQNAGGGTVDAFKKNWKSNEKVSIALLQTAAEICDKVAGLQSNDTAENWNVISELVGCTEDANKSSRLSLLYSLLHIAVSDASSRKSSYINRIMALDKETQTNLMLIIQESGESKQHEPRPDESYLDDINIDDDNESLLDDDDDIHISINKENIRNTPLSVSASASSSKATPHSYRSPFDSFRSPMSSANRNFTSSNLFSTSTASKRSASFSPNGMDAIKVQKIENEAIQLKHKNEALCDELSALRKQENVLRLKLEENEVKRRAEQMKIESDAMVTISEMRDKYEGKISSLRKELEKSQKGLREAATAKEEVRRLQDEVDVLQGSKTKLFQTEEQLRKMKAKVEQMNDMSKALTQEEVAHSEAISKCLKFENEIATLIPLKRQLEEYKTRATDAEVRLVECEDEIKKLKESSCNISGLNKEFQINSLRQQAETEDLRRKIQLDGSTSHETNGRAVGEGMSELNPVLKEELLRLRSENLRLATFAEKREVDSVQKMEEQLDDASRLSAKLKEQYLSTKHALVDTKAKLESSLQRERVLRNNVDELQKHVTRLELLLEEEHTSSQIEKNKAEKHLQDTKLAMTDNHRSEIENIVGKWTQKVEEIEYAWNEKHSNLIEQSERREEEQNQVMIKLRKDTAIEVTKIESQGQEKVEMLCRKHKEDLERIRLESSTGRQQLVEKGKQMIQKLMTEAGEKEQSLENALKDAKQERDTLLEQQKLYEQKVNNKLASYRQKLNLSQSQLEEATKECEDLQIKCKKHEREKSTLQDENDRFRRQLNNQLGSDKGQYEALQREYNNLLEENQALKQASNGDDLNAFHIDPSKSYSRGNCVSASSLSQLRAEYEDKIEELSDEKRQLIMKNSALITEEQKAMKRAWELEMEVKKLQNDIISLQLQLERMDRSQSSLSASKKRLSSKLSPSNIASKASKIWKSSKMAKAGRSPEDKNESFQSPSNSTLPSIEMRSPEFKHSIDRFKQKLANRLSSAKKLVSPISRDMTSCRNLTDGEWEFQID